MSKWDDWGPVAVVIGTVATVGVLQWKSVHALRDDVKNLAGKVDGLAESVHSMNKRIAVVETRLGDATSLSTYTVRELVDMRFEAEQAEQDKLVQAAEANE